MFEWNDKKSVLKIKKKLYRAGEIIPHDELSKERLEKFIEQNKVKKVVGEIDMSDIETNNEKPKAKTRKSTKKAEIIEEDENAESTEE